MVIDWGNANKEPQPVICPSSYNRDERMKHGEPTASWPDHICITSRYFVSGKACAMYQRKEMTPEEEAIVAEAKERAKLEREAKEQDARDKQAEKVKRETALIKKQREEAAKKNKATGKPIHWSKRRLGVMG